MIIDSTGWNDMKDNRENDKNATLPYDESDLESIIRYASRLTGRSLEELIEGGELRIEESRSKGRFGQIVERDYFGIPTNSIAEPDFRKVGMELKVTPMKKVGKGLVSKERLVLGIIDYDKVPELGFDMFLKKSSHILIVFYLWEKDEDMLRYRFLKVVDWTPSEDEIRMIESDWNVIEDYVETGRAHLLSEKHTKLLAACTKGAGHGKDMRHQPFSDIPAQQRALSFKQSFMTSLFNTHQDVSASIGTDADGREFSLLGPQWPKSMSFEDYVGSRFKRFAGRTCSEIEEMLEIDLNSGSKQYYSSLVLAMLGAVGKKRIKEFDEAGIVVKTVRIRSDGRPKESMSFPYIRYDDMVYQAWEDSDFFDQLDHEFLIPVFRFPSKDLKIGRKELLFEGAFFWTVPDDDFATIGEVWEDTRRKVSEGCFEGFVAESDRRIAHVRPHARNSEDMYDFHGRKVPKKSFWLNSDYIRDVVKDNL